MNAEVARARTPVVVNGRFLTQEVSGVQRYAYEVTKRLASMPDLEVRVAAPRGTPDSARAGSLPVQRAGRFAGHLWEQLELPRMAKGCILVSLGNTGPLAVRPQLVVMHDAAVRAFPTSYSAPFRFFYRAMQPRLARRVADVVTDSEFSASELQRFGIAQSAHPIPAGVDHLHLASDALNDAATLTRLGLSGKSFVLIVGNRHAAKNLAVIERAMDSLGAEGIIAVVVGSVADGTTGSAKPCTPHTLYTGRLADSELSTLYSHALATLAPSKYEGFGLTPLEAMRAGSPVIAADIPVVREVCGDGPLYFDPDDDAALTEIVRRVRTERNERAQRIAIGRQIAARYTWDATAHAIAGRIEMLACRLSADRRAANPFAPNPRGTSA
jgi:glycosyltransferase involved in cell wall biosynthesis